MTDTTLLQKAKEWQLDNLPYEIMWFNREGEIVYLNKRLRNQLGYTKNEIEGLSIHDINPRTTKEEWTRHWEEVIQDKTVNFRTIHKRKDGFLYDVEVFAQFFSNNRKDLICAVVNEITHSSFYRRVLNKAEELVCVGGWKLNLQDNSIIATDQLLEIFGVEAAEDIRPINLIRFFKAPDQFQELVSNALVKAVPFDEVLEIEDARGTHKWLRCAGQPIIVQNKINKLIGVYQDVSESQENILSLHLYKEIINQSDDIVFIWSEAGKLIEFSDSAIEQLGFSEEEFEQVTIYDLDEDIDEKWWAEHFEDIKNRKHFRMEWKATRKDGSQFPVDISVNLIEYRGQNLNCAILRDISKRKRYEDDLKNAFTEIESLKNQLEKENEYLQEEIRHQSKFENIICKSKAYAKVLKQIEQVAPTETTVLITGESGTGKELLANALHQHSNRKEHAMVKVNCATLPKELFESELFGHKKGSFTGAIADKEGKFSVANKGTIFLDEIGEVPVEMQAKLLRVLQEGEFDILGGNTVIVDVRIIAATNRNLEKMVEEGTFREDLYYRLNVFPIRNIPLRERKEDIPALAQFFLERYAAKAGKPFKRLSKKTIEALTSYPFPGNIRELENLIERAVIIEDGTTLFPGSWMPTTKVTREVDDSFKSFEDMQKDYIQRVLISTKGKVSGPGGAAEILEMKDKTLFAKMKKLGIKKQIVTN
ncbi:MAG: sigma 54-interacting transcriptional regulator [Bacteroidota bacterium]